MAWWKEDIAKPGLELVCIEPGRIRQINTGVVYNSPMIVGQIVVLREIQVLEYQHPQGHVWVNVGEIGRSGDPVWSPPQFYKPLEKPDISMFTKLLDTAPQRVQRQFENT